MVYQDDENDQLDDSAIEQEIADANLLEEQLTAPPAPSLQSEISDLLNKYKVAKAPPAPKVQAAEEDTLNKAIEQRDKKLMMGNLLKSFQQITQAGVNVADPNYKANTAVADSIIENAKNPIEDYKTKNQMQRNKESDTRESEKHTLVMDEFRQKLDKSNLDIMNQQKLSDPNSDESRMAQDFVLRLDPKLNEATVRKTNASTLFKMSPLMQKMIVDKLKAGQGQSQITNIQDQDGVVRAYLVDKNTGEMKALGQAGYALGQVKDPVTGLPMMASKSALSSPAQNIPLPSQQPTLSKEGQPAEKMEPSTVGDYRKSLTISPEEMVSVDKDKEGFEQAMKPQLTVAASLESVPALVDEATRNPNAAASLGGIIGSMFEPGKLTDEDALRYIREKGLENKLKNWLADTVDGKIRPETAKNITATAVNLQKELQNIARRKAVQMANSNNKRMIKGKEIDPEIIADYYYSPKNAPAAQSDLVKVKGPSGQVATMKKEVADKYLQRPGYTLEK